MPRIVNSSKMRHDGRSAVGELVHVEFAEAHGSSVAEPGDDGGVFSRNAVGKQRARCGRAYASRIDVVFQADRDAMKRTPDAPRGNLVFARSGFSEGGVGRHGDERIHGGTERLDPGEIGLRQLDG